MSATKAWLMQQEELPDYWLTGDRPSSGYEEPIPDEPPKDYVVIDDKTDELPF